MAKKAGARASKARSRRKPEDLRPDEAPREFLNREIQWLEFNARVLHEAVDERTPLLERVRFLGIFTSNLDEFFMKRVGGLKRQVEVGVERRAGGLTPVQQLAAIRAKVLPLLRTQADCYRKAIAPELEKRGVGLVPWDRLTAKEKAFATGYFKANVFPVLTPLAVDPALPFPFISNLSVSLGVTLRHPEREEKLFARIKVPKIFPQWFQVRGDEATVGPFRFVSLTDVLRHNLKGLFPDMEILDVMPFRITRNADIDRDEEDTDDLLETIAEELKQRRFAEIVRLEHGPDPDPWMLQFLKEELELTDADVYECPALLDYADLKPVADLAIPELKYEAWTPLVPPPLQDDQAGIFQAIKSADLLVHHPYESFGASVERFIKAAVDDPKVLAIKMTLYRTGDDSPFIPLLIRAAEKGKQVVVLIELKARFDEERNIHWAQELEDAGVHVVYGVVGLKTHAKVALVIRQESDGVQCYVHLGTGNYHKDTAKLYTDVGLFTSKPAFCEDVVELFHFLTGRSLKRTYRKLLVAPSGMKDRFLEMIRRPSSRPSITSMRIPVVFWTSRTNSPRFFVSRRALVATARTCRTPLLLRQASNLRKDRSARSAVFGEISPEEKTSAPSRTGSRIFFKTWTPPCWSISPRTSRIALEPTSMAAIAMGRSGSRLRLIAATPGLEMAPIALLPLIRSWNHETAVSGNRVQNQVIRRARRAAGAGSPGEPGEPGIEELFPFLRARGDLEELQGGFLEDRRCLSSHGIGLPGFEDHGVKRVRHLLQVVVRDAHPVVADPLLEFGAGRGFGPERLHVF